MALSLALALGSCLQLSGQSCTTATCNAATANYADVLAALPSPSNSNSIVTVNIPAGNVTWTSHLNYTVPAPTGKWQYIVGGNSSSVASITLAPAMTVSVGQVVIASCRLGANGSSITVTDNLSNIWTSVDTVTSSGMVEQVSFTKVTNAGSMQVTCTPNVSSTFMAGAAGIFNWTANSPTLNAHANGTGNYTTGGNQEYAYVTGLTTTVPTMVFQCTSVASESGDWQPFTVAQAPASVFMISNSTLGGQDDTGCQFANVPYPVTGARSQTRYGGSSGTFATASVVGALTY